MCGVAPRLARAPGGDLWLSLPPQRFGASSNWIYDEWRLLGLSLVKHRYFLEWRSQDVFRIQQVDEPNQNSGTNRRKR